MCSASPRPALGLDMACAWPAHGMHAAFSRSAIGMQAACAEHALVVCSACARHAIAMQLPCSRCALGMHSACPRRMHGFSLGISLQDFAREAKNLRELRHPNMLVYIGWNSKEFLLVTELLLNGSL